MYGGYMKIGSLVFVSIIARTTVAIGANSVIITGLPKPYSANMVLAGLEHTGHSSIPAYLNTNGNICSGTLASGTYITIGGVYVCADNI